MFLLLLALVHVHAIAQYTLPLNSLSTFSPPTSLLALPPASQLTVSVAICVSRADSARFFLSNSTSVVPGPGGGTDVFEIQLDGSNGQWSGSAPDGGLLSVQDLSQGDFQVFISDNGIPPHSLGVSTTNRSGHARHRVPDPRSTAPARRYHRQPSNSLFAPLPTPADRPTSLSELYSSSS